METVVWKGRTVSGEGRELVAEGVGLVGEGKGGRRGREVGGEGCEETVSLIEENNNSILNIQLPAFC